MVGVYAEHKDVLFFLFFYEAFPFSPCGQRILHYLTHSLNFFKVPYNDPKASFLHLNLLYG